MDRPPPGGHPTGPGLDVALAELRRRVRRRLALVVAGLAATILGAMLEPAALGWPGWTSGLVVGLGLVVALAGAFGLRAGLGCAGQLLLPLWIGGLACGLAPWRAGPGRALAAVLLAAGIVAIVGRLLRRRVRDPDGWRGPAPGTGPAPGPGYGLVIDVDGHDGPATGDRG